MGGLLHSVLYIADSISTHAQRKEAFRVSEAPLKAKLQKWGAQLDKILPLKLSGGGGEEEEGELIAPTCLDPLLNPWIVKLGHVPDFFFSSYSCSGLRSPEAMGWSLSFRSRLVSGLQIGFWNPIPPCYLSLILLVHHQLLLLLSPPLDKQLIVIYKTSVLHNLITSMK